MEWRVYFYQNSRGDKVVKEFIKGLQPKAIGGIVQGIKLLKTHGPILGMPYSRMLLNGIYELRVRGREEIRILYSFSKENIYLLHAFKKKSRKTPGKEIKIAKTRNRLIDKT